MAGVSLVSVAKCRISDVGGFGYSQQATHERPNPVCTNNHRIVAFIQISFTSSIIAIYSNLRSICTPAVASRWHGLVLAARYSYKCAEYVPNILRVPRGPRLRVEFGNSHACEPAFHIPLYPATI